MEKTDETRIPRSLRMQLRANPGKWAAIAALAGFGLGLVGRIMRRRAARASSPHIVVIDGAR